MGFFKGMFGGGEGSPPPPPPGQPAGPPPGTLTPAAVAAGPFPKAMRVRAVAPEYNLVGSWQEVVFTAAADFETVREQVFANYYRQYGLYRLPDGSQTVRWNEQTWRELRATLQIVYDTAYRA
jgi:hypothetical protein